MQIQIISADPKNNTRIFVAEHKLGQSPLKHVVQSGQKITLVVDGVTLTGAEGVAEKKVKLVRIGRDLVIETLDGAEKLVELTHFYEEQNVVLMGDKWTLADGSQLQQLSDGVTLLQSASVVPAHTTLSAVNTAAGQVTGGGSWVGEFVTGAIGVAIISIPSGGGAAEHTSDTQGPAVPSVAVPEAAGGINAAEAANGVPVVVTLPADAAVGDVITVNIDGGTAVSYTVTANDIDPTLNPGGTVSVVLPQSAIAAAGEGAATIITSYTDAAGNSAANSPISTSSTIDTQGPAAPSVAVPEAAGGINAAEAANGVPVVVTLSADAAVGDVITVNIDGGTAVSYTVTANDIDPTLNPGGTVSVVLPQSAIAAAGEGAATITTSYTDAAGNSAANSPISTSSTIDTQGPAAPSVAVPEAAGGINAAEAANGVPVVVTLPADAAVGDVITVNIDGGTAVSYTVTANDIDPTLNPGGTVSVVLPQSAIAAAGEGAATITTSYTDAAGNSAANSPISTSSTIDTQGPAAPSVAVPEAAGGINAAEAANGVPVVVTLPADAAVGDVITVNIDGGTAVSYTVTANDIDPTLNPGGTVSVVLPQSAIAAAGEGAATITTSYTYAAGNSAANSPIGTSVNIETLPPSAPTIALHEDTANAADFVTSNGQINVTYLEVGATWQYSLDGGQHWQLGNGGAAATGTTGNFVVTPGIFATGSILVRQTDAAGNVSADVALPHPTVHHVTTIQLDGISGFDNQQQITALADGGYVVTWHGYTADWSSSDVFLQRYDSNNQAMGVAQQLDAMGGNDHYPQLSALSDGGYVVTWVGEAANGSSADIFVQRYDSNNLTMGAALQIDGWGGYDQLPEITSHADGGYMVTWQGFAANWSTSDTFVQRYDSNNQLFGVTKQLDGIGGADQYAQITALADGGYVVIWQGYTADSLSSDTYVQRYDNSNQAMGAAYQLDGVGGYDINPQVTALADGGYVVTWHGQNASGASPDIFLQRYDNTNQAIDAVRQIDGLGGADVTPQITALADGGYVVTWYGQDASGANSDIFLQRYDNTNQAMGAAYQLDGVGGYDINPQITVLADGGYVVTWKGDSADSMSSDTFVQRFDNTNQAMGAARHLDGVGGYDIDPQITALSDGGYVVTWQGQNVSGVVSDIFVQRFDAQDNYYGVDEVLPLVVDIDPPTAPTVDTLSTSNTTPTITGTAVLLWGESLTVVINGASYKNVTVAADLWSIDTATAVASSGTLGAFVNGQSYSVVATVTDTAGHSASNSSSKEITIDTQLPGTPSLDLARDVGGSGTDLLTSDGTINVSGLEVGATWQYSLDGGNSWLSGNSGAAATATTGSFVASAGSYGASSVLVKQTDAAGNASVYGVLDSTYTLAQRPLQNQADGDNREPIITALDNGAYVVAWWAETDVGMSMFTQMYDGSNRAVGSSRELSNVGPSSDVGSVTATPGGGYAVAWRSGNATGDTRVLVQYFDADNNALGPFIELNQSVSDDNVPVVQAVHDGSGAFVGTVVVWLNGGSDIYSQAFDDSGNTMGAAQLLLSTGVYAPSVTPLVTGGYVVFGVDATPQAYVQAFDSTHTAIAPMSFLPANADGSYTPDVVGLADGGFVVIHNRSSNSEIYVQRFDAAGASVGTNQLVSINGGSWDRDVQVVSLAGGDYMVAWSGLTTSGNQYDVHVQRFDGVTSLPVGTPLLFNGEAGILADSEIRMVTLTDGSVVMAWQGNTTNEGNEIFLQRFDASGASVGSVEHLTGLYPGQSAEDGTMELTALSDGGYALAWSANDPAYTFSSVAVKRFDANGNLMPETVAMTVDNTAPTLKNSSPADEGVVGADANISLSFSENIALGSTGHVLLKNLSGGADIDIDLANSAGQLSVQSHKLVINPSTDLMVSDSYAIHLEAGAVTDTAGNAFAGIADDTTLNFVAGLSSALHLGTVSGIDLNLIGGFTTSGGQHYYYLDTSNNGTAMDSFMDGVNHDALDDLFNGGADTVDTQPGGAVAGVDDARTVLVGGYTLVLPTEAELTAALAAIPNGSSQWSQSDTYWSATQTAAEEHTYVNPMGFSGPYLDIGAYVVAIQVVM